MASMHITLEASFCSEQSSSDSSTEDTVLQLHGALDAALASAAGAESDGLAATERHTLAFREWGGVAPNTLLAAQPDPRSGEPYLVELNFRSSSVGLWGLVVNFVVVASSAFAFIIALATGVVQRWKSHLRVWGAAYFGPKWRKRKNWARVREQAGFFFMAEFVVGYPRLRTGLFMRLLTVIVDLSFVILPIAPLLLCATVTARTADDASRSLDGTSLDVNVTVAVVGVTIAYAVSALVYLIAYYLGLGWKVRRILRVPFLVLLLVNLLLSMVAIANCFFWILMGAAMRPAELLPAAVVLVGLLIHIVSALRRVGELSRALPSEKQKAHATTHEVAQAMAALDEGLHDWYRRHAVRGAVDSLGQLRVLELTGTALRDACLIELVFAAAFVACTAPIGLAHRAFARNDLASSISSAAGIAFVTVALQLARPLVGGSTTVAQHRWEAAVLREAASMEAAIKNQDDSGSDADYGEDEAYDAIAGELPSTNGRQAWEGVDRTNGTGNGTRQRKKP